ncbi:MAG: aminotransferase class V-fold PLP-dependent enzyme, partial [Oscillospiraceae bacterium]
KINEQLCRQVSELHPLQDEDTVQGMLQIFYETDKYMQEISGMDKFTFQPGGGSQGLFCMASITKAYFDSVGSKRDEFITTIYSHPSDSAAPTLKGYKIIFLQPDPVTGLPTMDAFKAACTEKTAGFIQANPEDTGLYNGHIKEFTDYAHKMGALCCYDQANGNAVLGVARAKEAGFDMCHFNLHKTFSTPHGCGGPACGATGVRKGLEQFLPAPVVDFDGKRYFFNYELENKEFGVHKVRSFYGVAPVIFKTYCWIRSMGANGLYQVTKTAVLNNNYMYKRMLDIDGISAFYIDGNNQRVEQCRYTMEKIFNDTGVSTTDIQRRMMDFGMHYWTSHHPFFLPEPITLEPTETPSKEDIDEYVDTLIYVFKECYENPEYVKSAPHNSTIHQVDESGMD